MCAAKKLSKQAARHVATTLHISTIPATSRGSRWRRSATASETVFLDGHLETYGYDNICRSGVVGSSPSLIERI